VRLYVRRLALLPAVWALVAVAENARHFWDFDANVRREYEAGRARGAPPLETMPSRRQILALTAGMGAMRGFSFAAVRPLLPERPESAALVHSLVGETAHAAVVREIFVAFQRHGAEIAEPPSIRRWIRAAVPGIIWRVTVTAGLERLITREVRGWLRRDS
jgi:hypothetical protein